MIIILLIPTYNCGEMKTNNYTLHNEIFKCFTYTIKRKIKWVTLNEFKNR